MSSDFATVNDVIELFRPLSTAETARVTALIPLICDSLRIEAEKVGKDIDIMIAESASYANLAKLVTVDIVGRILRQDVDGEPMSQASQSALGYSWSGTYAIPGGGMAQAIMKNDLKRLGLRRQKIGAINLVQT